MLSHFSVTTIDFQGTVHLVLVWVVCVYVCMYVCIYIYIYIYIYCCYFHMNGAEIFCICHLEYVFQLSIRFIMIAGITNG